MTDELQRRLNEAVQWPPDGPPHAHVAAQKVRFLNQVRRPRSAVWRTAAVVAAAGALVAAVWLWRGEQPETRTAMAWTASGAAVRANRVVTADAPGDLVFSGGTRVHLAPATQLVVERADGKAVVLRLDRGAVRCRVHGNGHTRWSVRSGAVRVTVMGTEFSVARRGDAVQVRVHAGVVQVEDGAGAAVTLRAGARWSSADQDRRAAAPTQDAAAEAEHERDSTGNPVVGSHATDASGGNRGAQAAGEPLGRAHGSPSPADGWQRALAAGDAEAALRAVRAAGISRSVAGVDPERLVYLVHAARRAHDAQTAHAVAQVILRRYGSSRAACEAAYLDGLVLSDQQRSVAGAADAFAQCARPACGAYHEMCLGRLVEVTSRSGSPERARAYAQRYLRAFPAGPFAPVARGVVQQGADAEGEAVR